MESLGSKGGTLNVAEEVEKYLAKENKALLIKYSNAEKESFMDGARWMFSTLLKAQEDMRGTIAKLKKRILDMDVELNEYRQTFDPTTYGVVRKKKKKVAKVDEEEDEASLYYNGGSESNFDDVIQDEERTMEE